ncbi:hypothetical protein DV735_g4522, partial [Chaetothyriales sp. CBS 134920]
MASEIADSDAESDTTHPNDTVYEPRDDRSLADSTAPPPQISPLRVDFDDFLGPSQSLSDQSPYREGLSRRGTDRRPQDEPLSSMEMDVGMQHDAAEAVSLPVDQLWVNNMDNDQATANPASYALSPPLLEAFHQQADLGASTLLGNSNTSIAAAYPPRTVSSYGGYQPIELNFRDGLCQDINPFGEPTQASLDGAGGGDGHEHIQQATVLPNISEKPVHGEAFSSPPPVPASLERQLARQSKRRKTDDFSRAITTSPAPPFQRPTSASSEPAASISDHPQPKKRGRKPKSKLADSVAPDDMGPPSTRSKPVTLDSSQLSHEETPSNTKRKRRGSKAETRAEEASVSKHTSSELQPDEDELIGLPKENYKPRPSRRRSKPLVVEEPADPDSSAPFPESVDIGLQKPGAEAATEDQHTAEPRPPAANPSKRTKKSKVKRAKTSAAALLRKSCQMISDGEEDVIWLDEKPTTVKLDLPADLKRLKKEEVEAGGNTVHVEIPVTAPGRSQDKAPTPEPLSDAEEGKKGQTERQQTNKNDTDNQDPKPNNPSAWNSKSRFRVGLSKRQSIPSLLRKVDKTKAAPTKVGVQVKERKLKEANVDGDDSGDGDGDKNGAGLILRDKDGNLVEWEF